MALITTNNLTKSYGVTDIFSGLTISIGKGERLGIVGPNGVGKTSLLRILAGEDESSSGSVTRTRGVRTGYLSQEADFKMEGMLWDACHSVFEDLIRHEGQDYKVWEDGYDARDIFTPDFLWQNMEYIHYNPCRPKWNLASSPELYPWSSARFYMLDKPPVIPVDDVRELFA